MASELGAFLASSRQRVQPADVGLPAGPRRRVPGLRREEVALLAGVSVDYYVRLEQGRETTPSGQVVTGVGRALRLDEYGLAHLYTLAGLTPQRSRATSDRVEPDLLDLIEAWPLHPAMVLGQAFDVVASNSLAERVFPGLRPTVNLLEALFLDPDHAALYDDWNTVAGNTVAGFRLLHAAQPDDARIGEVLGRLLADAPRFPAMWNDRQARGRRQVVKRLDHPQVGVLDLRIQTFDVRAAQGQELVVYRAAKGSVSEQRLRLLRERMPAPASQVRHEQTAPAADQHDGDDCADDDP